MVSYSKVCPPIWACTQKDTSLLEYLGIRFTWREVDRLDSEGPVPNLNRHFSPLKAV